MHRNFLGSTGAVWLDAEGILSVGMEEGLWQFSELRNLTAFSPRAGQEAWWGWDEQSSLCVEVFGQPTGVSPLSLPVSFSQHCLSEIEVLAIIFAAAIHDYEHTGTTNSFHIQTK